MPLRLAVGLPAYRSVIASAHALMWGQFCAQAARQSDDVQIVMFGHVDAFGLERARNALVGQARKAGADVLLMVDSDTWALSGKDMLRMILERPTGSAAAAVVAAPVLMRGNALVNCYRGREPIPHDVLAAEAGPYHEVDVVGGAILAIDLARVARHAIDFRQRPPEVPSGDMAFCLSLREQGEHIYVDSRVATAHVDQPKILTYQRQAEVVPHDRR